MQQADCLLMQNIGMIVELTKVEVREYNKDREKGRKK